MDVNGIIKHLGRAKLAERVGVTPNAVTEASRSGLFPSSWYMAVRNLCEAEDLPFSEDWFRWKEAS